MHTAPVDGAQNYTYSTFLVSKAGWLASLGILIKRGLAMLLTRYFVPSNRRRLNVTKRVVAGMAKAFLL